MTTVPGPRLVQSWLVEQLRSDSGVQAYFGPMAKCRIYLARPINDVARPFMWVSGNRTLDASSDQAPGLEHIIDLQTTSAVGGLEEAHSAQESVRRAIGSVSVGEVTHSDVTDGEVADGEVADGEVTDFRVILLQPLFSRVSELRDGREVRGLMRVRVLTETPAGAAN